MSVVGTRPPLVSETELYELHHYARLSIKPGITGLWQVSGRSDITDFEEVVRLDRECLEEIAYLNGWISKDDLMEVYEVMKKNQYGQYLKDVMDGKYQEHLY